MQQPLDAAPQLAARPSLCQWCARRPPCNLRIVHRCFQDRSVRRSNDFDQCCIRRTVRPEVGGHDFDDLMKGLFKAQPVATLDALFAGSNKAKSDGIGLMQDFLGFGKSPIEDRVAYLLFYRRVQGTR